MRFEVVRGIGPVCRGFLLLAFSFPYPAYTEAITRVQRGFCFGAALGDLDGLAIAFECLLETVVVLLWDGNKGCVFGCAFVRESSKSAAGWVYSSLYTILLFSNLTKF